MKGIFIACNQALYEDVLEIMDRSGVRGFTSWEDVMGRGSHQGEPHYGSHAWSTMNSSLLCFVEEQTATLFLKKLQQLSDTTNDQGVRAFYWDIAGTVG
ncbi:MAG: hypothetical protein LUD68_07405 [Rikenellaceae bacterium]|nr:hypothetical protein [Rikenellaceae bacterium]